jgi:hypothetical protein
LGGLNGALFGNILATLTITLDGIPETEFGNHEEIQRYRLQQYCIVL